MHASTLGGSLQGPSKVIHVRHLPIDATREEIAELCEQWGTVARIRTGAGLKRDQAFVEFAELQSAINMMAFYSTSTGAASEIPRVRAKQVFLQYSNRTEVSESTGGGPDTPSNVLLVHIDDVPPDLPLTLSQLLTVFQAFGNVLKVTCYEKGCNYTVFIQYENEDIAAGARDALNGRAIPKFLLGDRADPIILRCVSRIAAPRCDLPGTCLATAQWFVAGSVTAAQSREARRALPGGFVRSIQPAWFR